MKPVFISVASAATGTNWTAFTAARCTQLHVLNNSGTAMHLRSAGNATASQILLLVDGQAWTVRSITDASAVEFRRADSSNTQATIYAEAE